MSSFDDAVRVYRTVREHYEALKKSQTEERKKYQATMADIEARFARALDKMGADSVKGAHGTVYKTERVSAKVRDWDATLNYIRENDQWDLLDHRVSKAVVQELLEETGELVPGVSIDREIKIGVRKPT